MTTMQPKTLAPCGADETNRRDLIRAGDVPTLSPASRGSSVATAEVKPMPIAYVNGLEMDDAEVEQFLSLCRREMKRFPRKILSPNSFVKFRNPATGEILKLTPATAQFLESEGLGECVIDDEEAA